MFQRKYMVVQRNARPLRGIGISIISIHWFRWLAARKASALAAHQSSQRHGSLAAGITWEVDRRCK